MPTRVFLRVLLFGFCRMAGLAATMSAHAAFPVIDDTHVGAVRVTGNKAISTEAINAVLKLRAGGPLSRALVVADARAIEALYRKAGRDVQVWTDMTHPGENEGRPQTLMTFRLIEDAKPRHYDDNADPLENLYGNTLICAAAQTGNDLCHLWLNRDGSFINFDAGEAKAGHYVTGPMRPDGKVPVCQYWDTPSMVTPDEINPRRGGPPPAPAAPAAGAPSPARAGGPGPAAGALPVRVCKNINYRTVCDRNVDVASLSDADRKLLTATMGEKFYHGNCYPTGPHDVGDMWFEGDDPFPGQLGMDKVFLIRGRQ